MDFGLPSGGEASELERRMLEAARRDCIPGALGARMAERFAVNASLAAPQGGSSAASQLGASLAVKAGMLGVLSLALVAAVAGWRATRPAARGDRPAPAVAASSPTLAADVPATRAQSRSAGAADSAAAEDDAALRAEIALLDRTRDALRRRASTSALALLDEHRARFARARLAPEALALRIEALVQGGARERAGALSRRFARAYPSHPLTDHVAKLAPP